VRLRSVAQQLKFVDGVATDAAEVQQFLERYPFFRFEDAVRFGSYLCHIPTIVHLEKYDALLASQGPYLAYFSRRPYLAAQNGGDLWLDCSRDDAMGQLQRLAFANA
jgi:hypothetical protein